MMSGVGQAESETSGGLDCFDSSQAKAIFEYFHTSWVWLCVALCVRQNFDDFFSSNPYTCIFFPLNYSITSSSSVSISTLNH